MMLLNLQLRTPLEPALANTCVCKRQIHGKCGRVSPRARFTLLVVVLLAMPHVGAEAEEDASPEVSISVSDITTTESNDDSSTIHELQPAGDKEEGISVFPVPEKDETPRDPGLSPTGPQAPILSLSEAVRQIAVLSPGLNVPVTSLGEPIVLLHDVTGDQQPEAFCVSVRVEDPSKADVKFLSDYSRLFEERVQTIDFALLVFENKSGKLRLRETVDFGAEVVYEAFTKVLLGPRLIAASMRFQIKEGSEEKWVIFGNDSPQVLTTFSFKETLTVKPYLNDIDEDGFLDVVVREEGVEEGTAVETFLTWYRWDGTGFTEHRTTNVVRNINSFLSAFRSRLLERDTAQIAEECVEPQWREEMVASGGTSEDIVFHTLAFDTTYDPKVFDPASILSEVRDISFPEILEFPFTYTDGRDSFFPLSFRVAMDSGVSFVSEVLVYLDRNPFEGCQFYLLPRER